MESPDYSSSSFSSSEEPASEETGSILAESANGRMAQGTRLLPPRAYKKSQQAAFASRFFNEQPDELTLSMLEGQASIFQSGNNIRSALIRPGSTTVSSPASTSNNDRPTAAKRETRRSQEKRALALEVQALDDRVLPATSCSNFARLKRMQRSRQERHDKAIEEYKAEVVLISDGIEQEVIKTGQAVQERLHEVDEKLKGKLNLLHDEARLMEKDYGYLQGFREELNGMCAERKEVIDSFGDKLRGLEKDRSERTGSALTGLISTLTGISYVLKGDVERIVEGEALEINAVIIANLRSITDLISRINTGQFKVVKDVLTSWSKAEATWRRLCHAKALKQWHALISSPEFQEPPERVQLVEEFHEQQCHLHNTKRSALLSELAALVIPCAYDHTKESSQENLTVGGIQKVREGLSTLVKEETRLLDRFLSKLDDQRNATLEAAKVSREKLRRDIHGFSALTQEDMFTEGKRGEGKLKVDQLAEQLQDRSLEEFFQRSGGLLPLLKSIVGDSRSEEMMYANFLSSLIQRLFLLVEAFKIKEALDLQGKTNDKTVVQDILEKLRVARTADIHPLVPKLQRQVQALLSANLGDTISAELSACLELLDNVIPPVEESCSAELAYHQPPLNVPDLRIAQKRLGVVAHASNLPIGLKQTVIDLYEVVLAQRKANAEVDCLVHAECQSMLSKTANDSASFLQTLAEMKKEQNLALQLAGERICDFYDKIAKEQDKMIAEEVSVDQKYEDELDDELDRFETLHERMEATFRETLESIRTAESEEVLHKLEASVKSQLDAIEQSYRRYADTCILSSKGHFICVQDDSASVVQRLSELFSLKMMDPTRLLNATENQTADTAEADLSLFGFGFEALAEPMQLAVSLVKGEQLFSLEAKVEEAKLEDRIADADIHVDEEAEKEQEAAAEEEEAEEEEKEEEDELDVEKRCIERGLMGKEDELSEALEKSVREAMEAVKTAVTSLSPCLAVDVDNVGRILESLRDSCLCTVLYRLQSRLHVAVSTCDSRVSEYNAELEERLRLHWPRLGRSDVQYVQPRLSQLISHQKKRDRHLRSLMLKFKSQEDRFQRLLNEIEGKVRSFKKKMRTYSMHLPSQNSAAAINGLGKRGRVSVVTFDQEVDETFERLLGFVRGKNELSELNEQFLDSCIPFEAGGNYNALEITHAKAELRKVDNAIAQKVLARAATLKEWLLRAKSIKDQLTAKLNEDLHLHLHAISVRDGLGQKYGAPRRRAQQQMRDVLGRSKRSAVTIDGMLDKLDHASTWETIPFLIDTLRKALFLRADYLGFLKPNHSEDSCLDLVEFKQPDSEAMVDFLQQDAVRQQLEIVEGECFRERTRSIEESCKSETKELYEREGLDEKVIGGKDGLPEALIAFLSSLYDRAESHRLNACRELRAQLDRYLAALPGATARALEDVCERSSFEGRAKANERGEAFMKMFTGWQRLRRKHKDFLRPQMANPNYTARLQTLKEEEDARAVSCKEGIKSCMQETFLLLSSNAQAFQERIVRCTALITSLVDDVLDPEDTVPLPGDAVVEKKRMNLKKMIRVFETKQFIKDKRAGQPNTEEVDSAAKTPTKTWACSANGKYHQVDASV